MAIELRPYQQAAVAAVRDEWAAARLRTLLVLPTGCGKTIVFSRIAADEVRDGRRVLILAHREELLGQAADKLHAATGLRCAREKAGDSSVDSWYRVVVGSVQTMQRPKRLTQFAPDHFGTIIIDEAHHALADGYRAILHHFDGARVLGVTATPDRGDRRNLGKYFDSLAYEYSLPAAIRDGYLCPIRALCVPLEVDIQRVEQQGGDYKAGDLGDALGPYLDQIARIIAEQHAQRHTVIFLPLVATAQRMRDMLAAHGLRAAEVHGGSEDRAQVLEAFARGDIDVLCNAMLLTEGWDCPQVDCVVVLRPTRQRGLYCQMVGRGTRPAPGKKDLLLLDFLWMTERHDLCRPAHLIASSDDVAQAMTERLKDDPAQMGMELTALEDAAQSDVIAQREAAAARELAAMRTRKRQLVDPLQYAMSIRAEDLTDYAPAFGWEMEPPSAKQIAALERAGIYPDDITNAGMAAKLLDRLAARRAAGLATPKQVRLLEGRGFRDVGTWAFDAANAMITRIAANGWRVPHGVMPEVYKPEPQQTDIWANAL